MLAAYYVSPGGSDAADGLSPASAWKTVAPVNAKDFAPGDQVLFQGGSTFNGTAHFSAEDAGTAIEAISRCKPDYVVLDYQLVRSTAVDVLRALYPSMSDVGFIVLTNHATPQYRRVCVEAGATWFLDKTRDFAKVKDIVAKLREPSSSMPPLGRLP